MPGAVRILMHTPEMDRLVGAASRLVTTDARGASLWESPSDRDRNVKLVRQLVRMRHLSVLEHAVATLSFEDVSILVEQYVIQFRLASFTVKSRRYVDFSSSGFYVPRSLEAGEAAEEYQRYVSQLFQCYGRLQEMGIPREDARFVLPYCVHSNFLCTMNLRELCHFISVSLSRQAQRCEEIRSLAASLRDQLVSIAPFLEDTGIFEGPELADKDVYNDVAASYDLATDLATAPRECRADAEIVSQTPSPDETVASTVLAQLECEGAASGSSELSVDRLVRLTADRRWTRNLEHAVFTFSIKGISLAGLTHLTRHRMQSLCVPDLERVDLTTRYVMPETVRASEPARSLYSEAMAAARSVQHRLSSPGINRSDLVYLSLCGNAVDVMTSMNARELLHFLALRTCNRAQWEIRGIAEDMLSLVRKAAPRIFSAAGPSCVRQGRCPEGKMTCGSASEMVKRYGG